jgi:Domain of unknown function (DUF4280)
MITEEQTAALEQKRAEKRAKEAQDSPAEKREVVMHGATLNCKYAQGPGKLFVTSNELELQDQKWATEGDGNNMVNLQFKGTCGHPKWPQRKMAPPPCMSVIKLTPWQNLGTNFVQEQKNLVKESYIECEPEFNSATASPIPEAASIRRDVVGAPTIIDAYFTKWAVAEGVATATKVLERGLSYQVAVIVETAGLAGKKLKIKIKSGKRKVFSDVNAAVKLIDLKDIEAVTDPTKYKDVKGKDEFEVLVNNMVTDTTITNGASFTDKAVLKLMINGRCDDLSFDMAELIMADADKMAFLFIEVECTEPNTVFNGKEGDSGKTNTFLNEEGKYFNVKYMEQPWIVTARQEQKLGVTEATHCSRISGEYHQSNRQHKPGGCATIDNAWCASFVGWCLKANNFSAQGDPGAYTYGIENTRYRAGFRITPESARLVDEKFDAPQWGRLVAANNAPLGSICVVKVSKHVAFSVAKNKDGRKIYYLGGNQGDKVCVGTFPNRATSMYPIEYNSIETDNELPIYYTSDETLST